MGRKAKKDARKGNNNVKILLIGGFADDCLTDIAAKRIKTAGYGNITVLKRSNLAAALADKSPAADVIENWEKDSENACVLPLFVREKLGDGKDCGLKCPYEFIIERKNLLDGGKYNAVKALGERIRIMLELLKREAPAGGDVGVKFDDFKDWMSGVMRKYLFLDDTVHGSSGHIDPEDKSWDWDRDDYKYRWVQENVKDKKTDYEYANHGQWLKDRFSSDAKADKYDPLGWLKPLMRKLWEEYFGDKELSLEVLCDNTEMTASKIDRMEKVYKPDSLPLSHGDRARFVTPTGKINVLLIDDNANTVTFENLKARDKDSDKHIAEWELFHDVFEIHPLQITPENFKNVELYLRELIRKGLSFDFALVDLCLGEEPGQDLLGYHLIKKVSKLFPHTPIVVYSRYKDMGHIMRAFHCGAMWFLEKGEEWKLPRHLMSIVKTDSWRREWRAIQEFYPVEFVYNGKNQAFDDSFRHTPEWQYLTAKSLEFFPGKFIEVKKMGGGISTAVTFSVQKGLKLDGKPLQSPMIIKIDTAPNTRMEFQRYFRYVRPYMANESGRIERPSLILDREHSAIVYTFAGRQDGAHVLDSMKEMLKKDIVFKASCDYEKYRKAFDMIFDEILPKIHHVTPAREFGGGENRHQEVFSRPEALDAKDSPEASFPNLQFGEVEERFFFETYLVRYPYFGERAVTSFEEQPSFSVEGNDKDPIALKNVDNKKKYEFHDIIPNPDGSVDLEAYDLEDLRKPYLLTGSLATHVAKFRRQMQPGSVLWVKELYATKDDSLRSEMFNARIKDGVEENADKAVKDWVGYVKKYYSGKEPLSDVAGDAYFELVEDVLLFCRALYACDVQNGEDQDAGLTKKIKEKYLDNEACFTIDEAKEFFKHIKKRFKCPIAICHGDLNYGNIMLESRKHPPKDEKPDVSQTITDAWLIDFARTRRDMIAHDFNVMFTDSFALLFDERLFNKSKTPSGNGGSQKDQKEDIIKETWDIEKARYERRLDSRMRRFIEDVMFAENSNPPDYLNGDARFEFVYKILRRIRKAALDAGISIEMYTLTTVLECLMALKLHLKKGMKSIRASAALFAVAKICFEHLCEDVELDLLKTQR